MSASVRRLSVTNILKKLRNNNFQLRNNIVNRDIPKDSTGPNLRNYTLIFRK